jgi:hypothetical protein
MEKLKILISEVPILLLHKKGEVGATLWRSLKYLLVKYLFCCFIKILKLGPTSHFL